MAIRILINGARGRMGQAVAAAAAESGMKVVGQIDLGDDPRSGLADCDVVVDFSQAAATGKLLRQVVAQRKAIVIGTTGHTVAQKRSLRKLASRIPCVWSGNYSVGVNLLFALTRRAASVLGTGFDAEVIEMHHRFKVDAPSGTADRLLEIILEERKLGRGALRHGRSGLTGARSAQEVGVHAIRGGDAVGDHTVPARWVLGQKPGLYDMQDVLGLR